MNKKKLYVTILIIILVILISILTGKIFTNKKKTENTINETNEYDKNIINQIKNEINSTADTNIYQVEDEYDGRHSIQIKPNIQFDTVLAGILKESVPTEAEINKILEERPTNSGIWVSKKSREQFRKILDDNKLTNFLIDENGYVYEEREENSEKANQLKEILKTDKLYIIDISGTCYVRDDLSGEIVEYPFERMDPNQIMEMYKNENNLILEITTNSKQKISNIDILETILLNMEEK